MWCCNISPLCTGKINAMVEQIQNAQKRAEDNGGYGKEIERALELVQGLREHVREQICNKSACRSAS